MSKRLAAFSRAKACILSRILEHKLTNSIVSLVKVGLATPSRNEEVEIALDVRFFEDFHVNDLCNAALPRPAASSLD